MVIKARGPSLPGQEVRLRSCGAVETRKSVLISPRCLTQSLSFVADCFSVMPAKKPTPWIIADQFLILALLSLGCSNYKISQFVTQFTNIERTETAVRLLQQRWIQNKEFQGIYDHEGKTCNVERLQECINATIVPLEYQSAYVQILDL